MISFTVNQGIELHCITDMLGVQRITATAMGVPIMETVNTCTHCHRSDWRKVELHSFEEAAEYGWITITKRGARP